jgi:hypothetical protein
MATAFSPAVVAVAEEWAEMEELLVLLAVALEVVVQVLGTMVVLQV